MLNVVDEFTRECLANKAAGKLKATDVIETLADLFITRGVPEHIRPDQGPEVVAKAVQRWITAVGAQSTSIERGSPWENGDVERFNGKLRDELLAGFFTRALPIAAWTFDGRRAVIIDGDTLALKTERVRLINCSGHGA
jgi:transposase InsO family protein